MEPVIRQHAHELSTNAMRLTLPSVGFNDVVKNVYRYRAELQYNRDLIQGLSDCELEKQLFSYFALQLPAT